MTETDKLLAELDRTRSRLLEYVAVPVKEKVVAGRALGFSQNGVQHAAAFRATLDLSRLLAKWRRMGAWSGEGPK